MKSDDLNVMLTPVLAASVCNFIGIIYGGHRLALLL